MAEYVLARESTGRVVWRFDRGERVMETVTGGRVAFKSATETEQLMGVTLRRQATSKPLVRR